MTNQTDQTHKTNKTNKTAQTDESSANRQPEKSKSTADLHLAVGAYLDSRQRYQVQRILSPTVATAEADIPNAPPSAEQTAIVLDQKPLTLSVIQAAQHQASGSKSASMPEMKGGIPAIAQPYLKLEAQMDAAIPYLHDAWQEDGWTVLLLEDRMHWAKLMEEWDDGSPDPFQILRWFDDVAQLWSALEPWHCCQSLLIPQNLCLDEDQCLCLRRLYCHADGEDPTLQDLGQLWLTLLDADAESQSALRHLCEDLDQGKITTVAELRSQLSQIANELQFTASVQAEVAEFADTVDEDNTDQAQAQDKSEWGPDAIATQHNGASTADQTSADQASADQTSAVTAPQSPGSSPQADSETEIAAVGSNAANDAGSQVATPPAENDEQAQDEQAQIDTLPPHVEEPWDKESAEAEIDLDDIDNVDSIEDDGDDSPTIVLPMRLLLIEDAGLTDIGRQRQHNEDSFSIHLDLNKTETPVGRTLRAKGLYILCDGMGGHAGGEVASALAVDILREYFDTHWQDQLPTESEVKEAIRLANRAIYDVNQQNSRLGSGRMGTTLVMLLIQDTHALVAHVGDSRLYRFSRRLGLQQVTVDHEVGQREIQRGVDPDIAYGRPDAYQLTQALGPRDDNFIAPDVEYLDLSEDTLLLLCSDGLSDNDVLETHSQSHVEPLLNVNTSLDEGVAQLINLGNQQNGHDNITAIAVRVRVRPKVEFNKSF